MSETHVIAVDLGGTYIRAGIVNPAGDLAYRTSVPTDAHDGPDIVLRRIADLIQQVAGDASLGPGVPVGIASPGPLDARTGTVHYTPNLPEWRDVPLVHRLTVATGRRIALANDGNCAALGEVAFGRGKGVRDLVYLALGTGVGGGVISNATLIDGVRGLGAEVGHMTVGLDGPRCTCGSIGCLEAYASGWAVKAEAAHVATTADGDRMVELAGDGELHAGVVAVAAREGDPAAALIINRAARALGAAMGTLANLFTPQMIVIGGGVAAIGDLLIEPAKTAMVAHSFIDIRRDLTVELSALGSDTGLYGAAALAMTKFVDRSDSGIDAVTA